MENKAYLNYDMIIKELNHHKDTISFHSLDNVIALILKANQIFLLGAGRSGCVMKMFANRLIHLGLKANIIGNVTTPPAEEGDLLILNSSSGSTKRLVGAAEHAKKIGVKILLFSSTVDSILYELADETVIIPGNSKLTTSTLLTDQPMGSLFEQSSLIMFDSIVLTLRDCLGETNQSMSQRHANLE
ncbi:hypothetical protein AWM75_07920 [Aerococcus urinaehominis]|uniref:Uncharacterized protein n=1 Tax=Aerococcus urinaehominis TaxID=128944 RepID=A0A0X8FM96_9LACT|nr:6-phospho-3-hexuloisomerase [Aerococcus urinaehominis]AMB99899.1 hypothetical protein AWM75_07920 [Aerococcus urinaehominis]SDM52548.1 6-phospho-3-hexuloisomerase [Aerococcus urinaehominis]